MELFDQKYVFILWDKELDGKKGFVAQNIASLRGQVNNSPKLMVTLSSSDDDACPFTYYADDEITCDYQFAYYDPYYEVRRAYLEGKQLQFKDWNDAWRDVISEPTFRDGEYRIKPSKIYYVVWNANNIYCDVDVEDNSKVLFHSNNKDEVERFIETHQYLHDIIKSAYEGKEIEYKEFGVKNDDWKTTVFCDYLCMHDFVHYEYRIKPNEIKYVPFDTVQELIDCWDSKHPSNINRPSDTMPLIWIRCKEKNRVYLITDFLFEKAYNCDVGTEYENIKLKELFNDYTFLDDSVIGKVENEK